MPTDNPFLTTLLRHFSGHPGDVFCRMIGEAGETLITWRNLESVSHRFVAHYRALDLGPGAEILVFLRHNAALYPAFFGAMLGGFVPSYMPCTSPRQDPDIYWSSHQLLLNRGGFAAIVSDRATFAEMDSAGLELGDMRKIVVEELTHDMAPFSFRDADYIALLQHSSGTTGLKKGVALSYRSIVAQIEQYGPAIAISNEDVIVSWLPLYHDMGLIACLLLPAYFRLPIIHIDPFYWIARPALLLEMLQKYLGTLVWLPNFAFEHVARVAATQAGQFDLSRVRAFINCSEPCKPATFDRFIAAFRPSGVRAEQFQCCYAMAETVFAVSQTKLGTLPYRIRVDPKSLERGNRPIHVQTGGVELIEAGMCLRGAEIGIYDERRQSIDGSIVGEIGVRASFLFSGYRRDATRTAENLGADIYYTKDLGFVCDGRVYVLGRIDDLIIVNGRNLYAHEVEAAMNEIDGAKPGRSVAVGWYDNRLGSEALVVICERQRGSSRSTEELRGEIVRTVYSTFEVTPRQVHIVDEGWLIKTTSGKISRKANLERLQTEIARR